LQSLNAECHKAKTAREAAARAAKAYSPPAQAETSLEFLRGVMNDLSQDPRLRVRAAITVAQYEHMKMGEGGKKEQKHDAAKEAAKGRFAPASAPGPLRVVGK
jgi:phage terminase small subunit